MFQLGLLLQLVLVGAGGNPAEFVNIERLSPRVIVAYWVGVDRRCNLTALQSQKGLVMIDTEECPRVMALIKQKLEQLFGRSDWAYVINTHGMHERNLKNLWRILEQEEPLPRAQKMPS